MFDKVFASFPLSTCKNLHTKKCMSIDTHNSEVGMSCERKKHMSINTLETEMICITGQLKYFNLQLKYPEHIIHNGRRTSYTHLHT